MTFLSLQLRSTKNYWLTLPRWKVCVTGGHVTSRNQSLSSNEQGRQRRETLGTRLCICPTKLALTEPSFRRFYAVETVRGWWIIQYYVIFLWCWVAAVSGRRGRLFQFDRSALSSRVVEEGDVTQENEDDKNCIQFVTLECQFENKEAVGKL